MPKSNGSLLQDIDKKLAVVVNDVSYLKDGHRDNKKKMDNIEKFTLDTNKRLAEGHGKISRNWGKALEVEAAFKDHIKSHTETKKELTNTKFRVIDVIFTLFMIIIAIVSIVK